MLVYTHVHYQCNLTEKEKREKGNLFIHLVFFLTIFTDGVVRDGLMEGGCHSLHIVSFFFFPTTFLYFHSFTYFSY